jgi:hypothetical protein
MLNHLLALGGRSIPPPLTQHLASLGRQLLKATEVLADRALLAGR